MSPMGFEYIVFLLILGVVNAVFSIVGIHACATYLRHLKRLRTWDVQELERLRKLIEPPSSTADPNPLTDAFREQLRKEGAFDGYEFE